MFSRATFYSLTLASIGLAATTTSAQVPTSTAAGHWQTGNLRPVPREQSRVVSTNHQHQPQRDGWNLKWRRSAHVPQPTVQRVSATADASPTPRQQRGQLRQASQQPELKKVDVSPAAWITYPQQGSGALELPPNLRAQDAAENRSAEPNFFENPFGDDPPADRPSEPNPDSLRIQPADPVRPSETRDMNQLRILDAPADLPSPQLQPAENAAGSSPEGSARRADPGPSLGDILQERTPDETTPSEPQDNSPMELPPPRAPSDKQDPFENPFGQSLEGPRQGDISGGGFGPRPDTPYQTRAITCEEFREKIAREKITQLSLDISPPFRPDVMQELEFEKLKEAFDDKQEIRTWRNIEGRELASGRLRDLAYEKAIIETEHGTLEQLAMDRLSEADLEYISVNWGLPKQCLLEQVAYTPRQWTPTTMTWMASDLCHHPLYFEEVNLERYGHTAGPILQPVVSSAHFFANIAVLPYKMGVHPPNECQYALGYYRPGNCAPWIVPPVPISLRGGLTQAAAATGLFWLVP